MLQFTSSFVLVALLFVHTSNGFQYPRVQCQTTKGPLVIEVYREWAPLGADRFLELVKDNFFVDIAFFRCVKRFLTQFGISDNPSKRHWHRDEIRDDPNLNLGIKKNYVSYAGGGPNTRSTQLFIAFEDLDFLGKEPWETPFGQVIEGQSTLDALYKGYGDIPPFGKGPDQQKIHNQGNGYVRREFPQTDFILSCSMVPEEVAVVEPNEKEEPRAAAAAEEMPSGSKERGAQDERSSKGMHEAVDVKKAAPSLRSADSVPQPPAPAVPPEISASMLDRYRTKHGREEELIIKAVLLLAVSLTILFLYMRYNAVGVSSKKL